MIQVASCEQALLKTNRKLIENHQSKTMFLYKMYTFEFEFNHSDYGLTLLSSGFLKSVKPGGRNPPTPHNSTI